MNMIDPKFMDEQLGIDRSKMAERYKQINEEEIQKQEVPQFEVEMSYGQDQTEEDFYEDEDEEMDVNPFEQNVNPERVPEKQVTQQPRPPKLARPGKAFARDKQAFPGGPRESEISAWKKQFGKVFATELETGEWYIWRTLNRFEYKEVMSIPNTNELTREEMICEVCVLFPHEYSYETMVNDKGGVPSMLSEQIMQKSGFTRKARVIAL